MGARRTWNRPRRAGTFSHVADADRREISVCGRIPADNRRTNVRPAMTDEEPIDTGGK
jgi:hypothetical protein